MRHQTRFQSAPSLSMVATITALNLLPRADARAQESPVVFQHGAFSNATTWNQTANRLAGELMLRPLLTTTNSCAQYEAQTAQLPSQVDPISGLGFVGHSNGGVISREFHRLNGRNDRVLTVGTPHQGAPLAENFLNGEIIRYGVNLARQIETVVDFFRFRDTTGIPFEAKYYAPRVRWFGNNLMGLMKNIGYGVDLVTRVVCPVLPQMVPGSAYLTGLNSTTNLSRESAELRARVTVTGERSVYDLMFYTLFPNNPYPWINARWSLFAGSITGYIHYSFSEVPALRDAASSWLNLAVTMLDMDGAWANLNGSYTGGGLYLTGYPSDPGYGIQTTGSDGVLPLPSQHFPQETRVYSVFQITHTQETRSGDVHDRLLQSLQTDFGIPLRPAPPPVLTAGISGPGNIVEYTGTTWNALSASGVPPYSYQWTVDGVLAGNGASLVAGGSWSGGSFHTVALRVTDSVAAFSDASLTVSVLFASCPTCTRPSTAPVPAAITPLSGMAQGRSQRLRIAPMNNP